MPHVANIAHNDNLAYTALVEEGVICIILTVTNFQHSSSKSVKPGPR